MRRAVRSAIPLFALLFAFPSFASITGTVMNGDGQAIAGAKISVYAPETIDVRRERVVSATPLRKSLGTATTDANGSFRVDVPKEQSFVDLRVDAAGYAPESTWSLANDDAGTIVLVKAPAKTGTITANGKPVANATVFWIGGTDAGAVTDASGHYTVPEPAKWAARIVVVHPDYAMLSEQMMRDAARMTPDRTLTPGVKVTGRVLTESGAPAAGAAIFLDHWPAGKTADDGTFTIAHAKKDWQEVEARLGARVARRSRAEGALTLKLAKGATLSGTVIDTKTQQPVPGAYVTIVLGGMQLAAEVLHGAITDAKGSYTIADVLSGNFALAVDRPGYNVPRSEIALVAGRTVQKALYGTPLGTIAGIVIDEQKRPVAAARISTRAASRDNGMNFMMMPGRAGRAAYSGPDGRFVAREVSTEADVIVDAAKKGYPPASTSPLRVNPGEKKSGITLTIPRGLAFSGRVLDKNNKPVSGAAVDLSASTQDPAAGMRRMISSGMGRPSDDVVRSASDGTFTVRVKEGRYDVSVKAEGYAAKTLRAQNVAFRLTDLTPGSMMLIASRQDAFIQEMRNVTAPAKDVNIELPPGGRIAGHVVDKATHQPVTSFQAGVSTARGGGGMVVQTPPMLKAFTADDGAFTLENLRPGSTQVVVSAPGYTQGRVANVEVQEGKTTPDVTVELETGVKLVGKVTGPDGSPLAGVAVAPDQSSRGGRVMRFDTMGSTTATDPKGEYTIEALEPGEKSFTFSRSGYVTEQRTVNLSGKEVRSDVQLSSGLRIAGTVVTDGGAPVADALVRASSASDSMFGREAHSDANGNFQFEGLAPGHYTFNAAKSGYASGITRDVDVSTGAPVRVTMKSGGTISGHVSGLTAEELQQTTVVASAAGTGSSSAPVDAGGNYRMEGAPTGTVRVVARVGGGFGGGTKSSEPKSVVLDPGSSATADIEFKSNTTVRGRVTRAGKAMPNAMVMFYPKGGKAQTNASATADGNGVYELTGLADGPYNVQVVNFERMSPFATTYEVKGSGTFDIDIRTSSVRGHVLDATTGQALDKARVEVRPKGSDTMLGSSAQMSGPDGSFTIDDVSRGHYQISADKEGFGNAVKDLVVDETPSDVELKLSPSAGITLRVVDARDGRLISAWPHTVDSQGRSKTITVTAPSSQQVPMSPGGTLLIKSKSSSSDLRFRLVNPDGTFYARGGFNEGAFALLPSPGVTTFSNVAPGTFRLEVLDKTDRVMSTTSVTINEGQPTTVEI